MHPLSTPGRWVLMSARPPYSDGLRNVFDGDEVFSARWCGDSKHHEPHWEDENGSWVFDITHWCDLPDPPLSQRAVDTRDDDPEPRPRYDSARRRMTRCQSDNDGDCIWKHCPQNRDGEPATSHRHCPLDESPPGSDDYG